MPTRLLDLFHCDRVSARDILTSLFLSPILLVFLRSARLCVRERGRVDVLVCESECACVCVCVCVDVCVWV